MNSGRLTPEFLQEAKNSGMIYAIYGICISSDNNTDIKKCQTHIGWLNEIKDSLEKLNWKDKEKHIERVNDGIAILNKDIERFDLDDPEDIWGQD